MRPPREFGRALLLAALAVSALAASGRAQATIRPGGSLRVEGDSSLHKWSSTATAISMTFRLDDGPTLPLAEAIKASRVRGLDVRIPVAGLKSGDSGLDRNLRKAMKAALFPDVVYVLGRYEATKGADDGVLTARAEGTLTIAGRTRPVVMDVEFRLGPEGAAVKGAYVLKMSDYGIKPPTLMLGAIKVRDPLTIRFDLFLKKPGE